ncbi:39S ribosomal protein L15, mitochondrial [Pieris napi]|uniref:Large ribosomal subunit protein uL15m n=1 Tax=Pieris macdunnoughi TaxID=345717 RepID=A0A821LWD4_9NEOP|nr:39S ribosomal protein L15, mitochondrial [Pieris napi]CAF4757989.1 unnamed protein product [Pieris macdunnoughi]
MGSRQITEKSLAMLRSLPRISLGNLRDNPGYKKNPKRGRGQHGGDKHGAGNKGSGQRMNYMRLGYETGNNPFYLRMPQEHYYRGHHFRRQYPPLSLQEVQLLIDKNRLDISKPIDIASIVKSGLYNFFPDQKHFGVNLTDEGVDNFAAKINIEVQWASEQVIAAIERNGGVITTAYYDPHSLFLLKDPKQFFENGQSIPRRMIPPPDAIEYYTSAKNRGYLADPQAISQDRLRLAQKYGYELPKLENDPSYEMLCERKDPRQIFYGLDPGWVINLKDQCILKPKDEELLRFFAS